MSDVEEWIDGSGEVDRSPAQRPEPEVIHAPKRQIEVPHEHEPAVGSRELIDQRHEQRVPGLRVACVPHADDDGPVIGAILGVIGDRTRVEFPLEFFPGHLRSTPPGTRIILSRMLAA